MDQKKETKTLQLQSYKNKEAIEAISWIYDLVMRGDITGICFAVKHEHFKHTVGMAGDYKKDPYSAIRPIKRLKKLVSAHADELEYHAELSKEDMT